MGTLPRPPRISDAEIVARYLAGEGRGLLGLRARVPDSEIRAILLAAGCTLRTSAEGFKASRAMHRKRSRRSRYPLPPEHEAA